MNISNKKLITLLSLVSILAPAIAFAQTRSNLSSLVALVMGYLNQALFLIMGVAMVMFVFYVVKYFMKPGTDRAEAGSYILYSVIGFFVILSFWGIVNILQNTFGLGNANNAPQSWSNFQNLFPNR